uniref:WSC domain-containing protein n=1 Tax=Mesocestoides corti TaxID=53468 RepID=A0A5K3FT00_MESCO
MASSVLTSLLLLIFHSTYGLWVNYSSVNILLLMSTWTEIKETTLEQCFVNCTNIGFSFDSGLYNTYTKMCHCGILSKPYTQRFLVVDPVMRAFTKENGLDCSCSQRIPRHVDKMATSQPANSMDECEDRCLEYDNLNNVAVFFKTKVKYISFRKALLF